MLSFAGLDPTGGAGLLADIKTFEQQRCLGMGIATAWTAQTEDRFQSVTWLSLRDIQAQALPLLQQYPVMAVKIGIMPDVPTILQLVDWLQQHIPGLRIVWDPVLAASTGDVFLMTEDKKVLETLLSRVCLLTPNQPEASKLAGLDDVIAAARVLAASTHVLLKGGHDTLAPGRDLLFTGGQTITLQPSGRAAFAKHGSGCILSAAIAARLAHGDTLESACSKAKTYIENILTSNQNLLAYHNA